MKKMTKIYEFPVVIEKDHGGYYFGYAPSLQGCYTQGRSLSETFSNLRDAITLHIEDRIATGEIIPKRKAISLTSLEVAI